MQASQCSRSTSAYLCSSDTCLYLPWEINSNLSADGPFLVGAVSLVDALVCLESLKYGGMVLAYLFTCIYRALLH